MQRRPAQDRRWRQSQATRGGAATARSLTMPPPAATSLPRNTGAPAIWATHQTSLPPRRRKPVAVNYNLTD